MLSVVAHFVGKCQAFYDFYRIPSKHLTLDFSENSHFFKKSESVYN